MGQRYDIATAVRYCSITESAPLLDEDEWRLGSVEFVDWRIMGFLIKLQNH